MARWLFTLVLASAAFGQTQFPKFEPNDPAAWANAIRNLPAWPPSQDFTGNLSGSSDFTLPPLKPESFAFPGQEVPPLSTQTCAIPLTRIQADPHIDPKMRVRSSSGPGSLENMPRARTIRVCPDERASR